MENVRLTRNELAACGGSVVQIGRGTQMVIGAYAVVVYAEVDELC